MASAEKEESSVPSDAARTAVRKQQYLILYNLVSALAWFIVLSRLLILLPLVGYRNVYAGVGEFAKWTQTGAVLEIVHSAIGKSRSFHVVELLVTPPRCCSFNRIDKHRTIATLTLGSGLVRSPLPTTFLQVLSRLILVWLIVDPHPLPTTPSPFYTGMLLAWSFTEVVRYGYFVETLRGADPGILTWFRYNGFFILYPLGISSEIMMVWKASSEMDSLAQYVVYGVLAAYVPGMSRVCLAR